MPRRPHRGGVTTAGSAARSNALNVSTSIATSAGSQRGFRFAMRAADCRASVRRKAGASIRWNPFVAGHEKAGST